MAKCMCQINADRTLVYSCAGAANVGQLADLAARQLAARGIGKLFCLAALGAEIDDMVESARHAEVNLVIDGCPLDCGLRTFERLGIDNLRHVRVTELGVEKGPAPETPDAQALTAVVSTAAQRLLHAE